MSIFRPSREFRRQQSGKFCPACGTRMHWQDVVALRGEKDLTFLHVQCAHDIAAAADAEAQDTES